MEFGEIVKRENLLEAIVDAYVKNNLEPITKSDVKKLLEEVGEAGEFNLKSWFEGLQREGYIEKVGSKWKPTLGILVIYGT